LKCAVKIKGGCVDEIKKTTFSQGFCRVIGWFAVTKPIAFLTFTPNYGYKKNPAFGGVFNSSMGERII